MKNKFQYTSSSQIAIDYQPTLLCIGGIGFFRRMMSARWLHDRAAFVQIAKEG